MLAILGRISRILRLLLQMGGDGQKFFKRSPPKRLRLFSRGFADILVDANRAMDILAKGLGRLGIPSIHP